MSPHHVRDFFAEKYQFAIKSNSRKREIVMQRRMIINFLFMEAKMRVGSIKIVFQKTHQMPCYFLKNKIHDPEYERFYQREVEMFKNEFMGKYIQKND